MFQLTFLAIAAVSTIVSAATLRAGLRGLVEPEVGVVGAAAVVGFAAMLVAGLRAAIAALGGDTTAEVNA